MEATTGSRAFATPIRHTTSPPITPLPDEHLAAQTIRSSQAAWKRQGLYGGFHFSPPSDDGHTQEYTVRSATPELLNIPRNLSRPSTSSGLDDSPRRGRSTPDPDARSETSNARSSVFCWHSEEYELLIEELSEDDPRFLGTSGLLKPDKVSEAGSDRAASPSHRTHDDIVRLYEDLYCEEEEVEEKNEAVRKWEARRSRYSARSKRTWSESQRSDYDTDGVASVDFEDAGASARHAKRRRSALVQRSSLIFDDPPRHNIAEVDEPEDEALLIDAPPPYLEVDWSDLGLRSLPFCILPDSESEFGSSEEEEGE